tara:strand:+ start:3928 stop:5718 length:1791 start_codon:yes stop_codon:yes gene_type:complete
MKIVFKSSKSVHQILFAVGALWLASSISLLGCDMTAKFHVKRIKFDRMQVVSMFPAEETPNGFKRVCSGPAQYLELNMNFVSTERTESGSGQTEDPDKDRSIRPGDTVAQGAEREVVEEGVSVTKDTIDIEMDCIEAYPDDDLTGAQSCGDLSEPASPMQTLTYEEITASRNDHVSVALVIDDTGSMLGLVNKGDYKEERAAATDCLLLSNISSYGSDTKRYRLSEGKTFINSLNDDDELILYSYNGEAGVKVVCTETAETELERANKCFGTRRDIFVNATSQLTGTASDRSNLWDAAATAWEFLKENATGQKHIVIVNDGPDTCTASEDYRRGVPACSATGYDDFLEMVAEDYDTHQIHVSFIQFQGYAYRDHDPRQWEAACLTGGQYIFINSEDLPHDGGGLRDALREAFSKIRYTLAGSWRAITKVPSFESDDDGGTPPGAMYAVSGGITLNGDTIFKEASVFQAFRINGANDNRLALRKSCSEHADCTASFGSCQSPCSPESKVCTDNRTDVAVGDFYVVPDNSACTDGSAGICCQATCSEVAECAPPAPTSCTEDQDCNQGDLCIPGDPFCSWQLCSGSTGSCYECHDQAP